MSEKDNVTPRTEPEVVHDVLISAAKIIGRGWTQGIGVGIGHGSHRVCVTVAISEAAVLHAECWAQIDARKAILRHLGLTPKDSLIEWNDAPGRTQVEVVDVLQATAKEVLS